MRRLERQTGRRPDAGGFTLIELVIVLVIVAFVVGAVAPSVKSITGANALAAAGELSGAMRYMFETAAMRHQTCRLAMDFHERAWWAECTKGKAYAGDEKSDSLDESDDDLSARFPDERQREVRKLLGHAKFGAFQDQVAKKRELPGEAGFTEVWSQHMHDPITEGLGYIYFYPQGQAELAQVTIADSGTVFSIVLQPLAGRAKVVAGKPDRPEVPR